VELDGPEDPATRGRQVTVRLRAGRPAVIGRIDLGGAEGEAAALAARHLRLTGGERYREAAVRDRLTALEEALRAAGYYQARVTLRGSQPEPDGAAVHLAVEVAAGPRYRVEFAGAAALSPADLRGRLGLEGALAVDQPEIEAVAGQLEAAYREIGRPFARVRGSLREEGPALRLIRFEIEEGPETRVEALRFTGNRAVSPGQLRPLIESRPTSLLEAGRFRQELLDRDLRVLEAFYHAEGYPEAAVGPAELSFSPDRSRVRIAVPIQEGPRLLVGRVAVEGTHLLAAAELLAAIPLKPGDPWSPQRAEEARRLAERLYARRGHLAAGVALETAREGERMDVRFRIQEGEAIRIGRIRVGGLLTTQEPVVRRELPFAPGDPFDPEKLQEAERRLAELGIFERVEVGPLRPEGTPYADVDVALREGRPWRLDLGAGYSTDQEWRGFLEVGHDNLFGGANSASLRETVASKGDRSDAVYRSRRLLGTPWEAEASLFREEWQEPGYRRQKAGITAGIQRPLPLQRLPGLRGFLTYRLNWVRRFEVDSTLAAADVVAGSQLVASLTPSLALDRRDDPGEPARGSSHLLSLELGDTAFGSEVKFVKFQLETRWYLDWLSPTVLALAGRLGMAAPYGGTPALDIDDRFKAGGRTSIRGYPEDRVGPVDAAGNPAGGNGRLLLNLEWRFPLWRWLGGVLFVDSGTVAPEADELLQGPWKTGTGAGLRVATPIGPLRVDAGYGLNGLSRRADRWQISFGIGHPF